MNKHLSRALAGASFALLVTSSCMKRPDLSSDNGTQATASAVQNAMVEAWGAGDFMDIKESEFMSLDVTRSIPELPDFYFRQYSQQVDGCGENAQKRIYAVIHNRVDNPTASSPTVYPPERLGWGFMKDAKDGTGFSLPARLMDDKASQHPIGWALYFLAFVPMCHEVGTQCYNLATTSETIDAPPAIAAQANCAGVPNCRIRLRVVSFDALFSAKDPDTGTTIQTKQKLTFKLAPDLPILSRLQKFCMTGIEQTGSSAYQYNDCYTVTNFRRGTTPQCQAIP